MATAPNFLFEIDVSGPLGGSMSNRFDAFFYDKMKSKLILLSLLQHCSVFFNTDMTFLRFWKILKKDKYRFFRLIHLFSV